MTKYIKTIALAAALVGTSSAFAADVAMDTLTSLVGAYSSKTITGRISVHDPSIYIDTITNKISPKYYIFGSHLGIASTNTTNKYQTWTGLFANAEWAGSGSLFANTYGGTVNYDAAYNTHAVKKVKNVNGEEVDFGNFNAHDWQYTGYSVRGNQWAPDVIWNKTMKKWCMYMSLNGDKWASVIVCFTSDKPNGPWIYQGPVVYSGFQGTYDHVGYTKTKDFEHTDLQIALGSISAIPARYNVGDKWGTYWPNCIDPCVFYDDNDDIWMSYGSWSGGIFMLKINPENGLRDYEYKFPYQVNNSTQTPGSANANCTCDPYFGKKIAGGYYSSGEASYIQKIGKYYYLFMSYGGLESTGGYQMRIFRSTKPDGPYSDVQGNSAIYNSYQMNYSSTSKTNRGQLLMGGYKWDTMPTAEIAQGHNSAMVDTKDRAFVVYHTRFNDGGEGHQVRVHQLFQTQDGWLMASPYEFSGETPTQNDIATTALYTKEQVVGTYQLIRHTYCQDTKNRAYQAPVNITLNEDGTVTGKYTGKWEMVENTSYINITLAGVTYKGVLTEQTIDYTNVKAMCFSALSTASGTYSNTSTCTKGLEIWGSNAPAKAAIKYTLDKMTIPVKEGMQLTENVVLPSTGLLGATVQWISSDPDVINENGVIGNSGSATLTLAISKDGMVYLQSYNVTVNSNVPLYYPVVGATNFSTGYLTSFSEPYTIKKGESARFKFYNYSKGTSNWENWLLAVYNNTARSTNYFVLRADNWEDKAASNNGCTSDFDWNTFKTDMNGALVDMSLSYTAAGEVFMTSTIKTTSNKTYKYSYTYPTKLTLDQIVAYFAVNGAYIDSGSMDGIEEITTGDDFESHIHQGIYDLNGRRYNTLPTQKGMYIVGSKKVLVK